MSQINSAYSKNRIIDKVVSTKYSYVHWIITVLKEQTVLEPY